MNQTDTNINEEIRNHIRTCILHRIAHYNKNQQYEVDYAYKNKNWAISIFLVTAGFCLKEREELGLSFYLIPYLPIILFLITYSLKNFMISKIDRTKKATKLTIIMNNLYKLSPDELVTTSQELFTDPPPENRKGKLYPKRFFKEKIKGITIHSLTLDNIIFFGGMILFWTLIVFRYLGVFNSLE